MFQSRHRLCLFSSIWRASSLVCQIPQKTIAIFEPLVLWQLMLPDISISFLREGIVAFRTYLRVKICSSTWAFIFYAETHGIIRDIDCQWVRFKFLRCFILCSRFRFNLYLNANACRSIRTLPSLLKDCFSKQKRKMRGHLRTLELFMNVRNSFQSLCWLMCIEAVYWADDAARIAAWALTRNDAPVEPVELSRLTPDACSRN